jgi:hypothetical protein
MKILFIETAEKELDNIKNPLNKIFGKHVEKIIIKETHRHLKKSLPYFVENVTKQARIVYYIEDEIIYIFHCFETHKEYEKWYKSYK